MWLFFVLLWIRLKLSISTYVNLPNSQYHIKTTVMDGNFNMWTMAVDKINAYCREKVWSWGTWWWQLIGLINSPCGKRSYNAIGPLALIVLSVQTIAPLYSNTELYVVYIVIYLRYISMILSSQSDPLIGQWIKTNTYTSSHHIKYLALC